MLTLEAIARHRRPYLLTGIRVNGKGLSSPVLTKGLELEEVHACAEAFLTDPRDTITAVFCWSEREQQCIGKI